VLTAVLLALGLAMDAMAAAAVRGMIATRIRARDALLVGALTGGFQAGMAALGWVLGGVLGAAFARYDHWIAFALLAAMGTRTIVGSLRGSGKDDDADAGDAASADRAFALGPLVMLAVATSIDAAAAGVSVALLAPPPWVSLALIGGVTFALAAPAVYVGRAIGARLGSALEVVGGAALIGIGVKILVEHLR
jgi:putative Mn2+ efflux pump MntP